MGTGCQILVLIAKPNFVLFLISFALLSALLALNGVGRGDGSSSAGQDYWAGVHLLKPPEPGVKGGQSVQVPRPTDHCQPSPAQFPPALPNLL